MKLLEGDLVTAIYITRLSSSHFELSHGNFISDKVIKISDLAIVLNASPQTSAIQVLTAIGVGWAFTGCWKSPNAT